MSVVAYNKLFNKNSELKNRLRELKDGRTCGVMNVCVGRNNMKKTAWSDTDERNDYVLGIFVRKKIYLHYKYLPK